MNIDEYRSLRKNKFRSTLERQRPPKKRFLSFLNKVMLTVLLFLVGLIVSKNNTSVKELINNHVYTSTFDFTSFKKLYNKYLGKYIGEKEETKEVFTEKLSYSNLNVYKDGVKLTVSKNYLVPALESGIVIFIGNKEGYGNTLILSQINGVDVWYSNIDIKDIKMYDYIEKGALIGEAKGDNIYMLFEKNGKFLNYKEYI